MVNIKCELCGSSEFKKDGDFFICEHCGCKYTIEQAKKLIIDGTVQVEGKVEINTSEKIKNLYTIARRSKDNNDWDAAKRYYDLVLQEDPQSWEAIFYLAYFDAYYCKNGELMLKAVKMGNCITSVVDLINQSNMSLKEKADAYEMIGKSVLVISYGLQERAKNFRNSMIGIKLLSPAMLLGAGKDQQTYYDTVVPMINCMYLFADGIEKVIDQFDDYPEVRKTMTIFWKHGNDSLMELFGGRLSDSNADVIKIYKLKILKYTPEEEIEKVKQELFGISSKEESQNSGTSKVGKVFSIISMITGIVFATLSFILMGSAIDDYSLGIPAFVLGIYGALPLVFAIIAMKKSKGKNGRAIVGLITGIAAIVFGVIGLILTIA